MAGHAPSDGAGASSGAARRGHRPGPGRRRGGAGRGGDNPTRAVSFVEELLDRCLALADTPRAYPLVPRYERFGIRRCVHGNYLIFYRLQPEQIEVIHVLQRSRDIEALLFGSP